MTRSKLSTKVVLFASGVGLSMAAFAESQPAATQSYFDEYACPLGPYTIRPTAVPCPARLMSPIIMDIYLTAPMAPI
jgi:hypothetical protein